MSPGLHDGEASHWPAVAPPGAEQTMQTSPVLPAWPPLVSAPSLALPATRELLQASPTRPDTERAATTIDVLNIVLPVCSAFEETVNALPEVLFMAGRPWYRLSGARVAQKGRGQRLLSYGVTGRKGPLKDSVHSSQLRAYAGRGAVARFMASPFRSARSRR